VSGGEATARRCDDPDQTRLNCRVRRDNKDRRFQDRRWPDGAPSTSASRRWSSQSRPRLDTRRPRPVGWLRSREAVAKILVLVRGVGLGLVFDELALIEQPLALGRLHVALVVRVGAPLARLLQVGGDRRGEVAELARRRAVPPLRGRATGYQFLVVPRRGKVVKRKPRAAA
jgi:hypothetical protein